MENINPIFDQKAIEGLTKKQREWFEAMDDETKKIVHRDYSTLLVAFLSTGLKTPVEVLRDVVKARMPKVRRSSSAEGPLKEGKMSLREELLLATNQSNAEYLKMIAQKAQSKNFTGHTISYAYGEGGETIAVRASLSKTHRVYPIEDLKKKYEAKATSFSACKATFEGKLVTVKGKKRRGKWYIQKLMPDGTWSSEKDSIYVKVL